MTERPQPSEPDPIEQEPERKDAPTDKQSTDIPEQAREDLLEEDRFQSTDN
jgi:hypothetical protein